MIGSKYPGSLSCYFGQKHKAIQEEFGWVGESQRRLGPQESSVLTAPLELSSWLSSSLFLSLQRQSLRTVVFLLESANLSQVLPGAQQKAYLLECSPLVLCPLFSLGMLHELIQTHTLNCPRHICSQKSQTWLMCPETKPAFGHSLISTFKYWLWSICNTNK